MYSNERQLMKKITMTEQAMIQNINEAVDSVMLPLLTELVTLGVSQELIGTAMMNIAERKLDKHDDTN